jgi:transcriptional regulator with PAS, ATPase and Fis domain
LLRVLQEQEFSPLGSNETTKINVRIISATNEALDELIQQNKFRPDLYYRLNVFSIELPPLRNRLEDLPILVKHFLEKYTGESAISEDTLKILLNYTWPGNIRELENVIQRAALLKQGEIVSPDDLPQLSGKVDKSIKNFQLPDEGIDLEKLEINLLKSAFNKTNGNQTKAAKLLGLSRPAFIYRMEKHSIDKNN